MQKTPVSFRSYLPGILLSGVVTVIGLWLSTFNWAHQFGFSALTLAIIVGMIIGNTVYRYVAPIAHTGITFSKGRILKAGIVLYGFRLTFQQIAGVGVQSILSDIFIISTTFSLAYFIGHKWLKLDRDSAILIGAGSSICGAAAVMATEPVVKAHAEKVTVAVATVVIFGTLGIFLYPEMYRLGWWTMSNHTYGVYVGSTIHEVAQVVAAGRSISPEVANIAVTTKMIRVMLLAPFLLALSFWLMDRRKGDEGHSKKAARITIPWFAFMFIGVAIFNSFNLVPKNIINILLQIDTILLTMAMAALGVTTHIQAIKQAGSKPLFLGLLLMVWLVVAGGMLQQLGWG